MLILLFYYDRSVLVRQAIRSVLQEKGDWELAIIDDSERYPIQDFLHQIIPEREMHRVKVYETGMTTADKKAVGGSCFGKFANQAIVESEAEFAMMLCDDDMIYPDAVQNTYRYFSQHPYKVGIWCPVAVFDSERESHKDAVVSSQGKKIDKYHWANYYNERHGNTARLVMHDASQAVWRTECNKGGNVWFPHPKTRCLDSVLFRKLDSVYGTKRFAKGDFTVQYKNIHSHALSFRTKSFVQTEAKLAKKKPDDIMFL